MAYEKFAFTYDALMDGAPYDDWVQFTQYFLQKFRPESKSILDIGCGTGEISIRLKEKGYNVTGIDISEDMLAIASEKSSRKNMNITWINQDMKELAVPTYYDVAISYCDVVNYLTSEEEIKKTFSNVNKALKDKGLFLFDIHSESYINNFLMHQTFAEVRDDISFIWFCEEGDKKSTVEHYLTFFVKNRTGTFDRFDEFHIQRTFPISFYQKSLQHSGFDILSVTSDFSFHTLREAGDRIFFVCQKREAV
jgi:ubiquinone/menaquinone biosynthesis C-methylase UbiE